MSSRIPSSPRASTFRRADRWLFLVSALCLGFWGWSQARSFLYQRAESRRLDTLGGAVDPRPPAPGERPGGTADADPAAGNPPTGAPVARAESGASGLIGRIELPRLALSGIIAEGAGEGTLSRAIGHVPRTAFPGEPGNVGLAAHRDSFFRGLKGVGAGDSIRITTPDGVFSYAVDTTLIVLPDRVDLLDSTAAPSVTLVTCYPFHYVGPAPKRFVVRAHQVGEIRPESVAALRTAHSTPSLAAGP